MLQRTLSRSPAGDLAQCVTGSKADTEVQPLTPTRHEHKDRITRNPRLLCVRNLPHVTEASDLLHFLNQAFRDISSPSEVSSRQLPEDIFQNIMVHDRVAILGCCSSRCVDSILQGLREKRCSPIVYRGMALNFGRPKNYVEKGSEEQIQGPGRQGRSIEGMVVVFAKRLDRE